MAGAKKRRQKHQNKTKARLIEELEALTDTDGHVVRIRAENFN